MKKLSTLALGVFVLCLQANAQQIDYKKIILPESISNVSIEERLVQLAWKNNPSAKVMQHDVAAAQYEVKVAATRWTSLFGAQGNLNEFTIKQFTNSSSGATSNTFYPRYNVYLNLPLSAFFEFPNAKKAARERVGIKEEQNNMLKLDIRARVLKAYKDYQKYDFIAKIRNADLEDFRQNFNTVEKNFKEGSASLEDYATAQRLLRDLQIQDVMAKNEFDKAKIDLEQLIGVKMEEVL